MHIRLNFQILIILILIFFTKQIEIYTITLIFIAVHEIAHIIAGMCLEYEIRKIEVIPLGFSILFKKKTVKNAKFDRLLIILAGPMANVLIALICFIIPINNHLKTIIAYSNILLSILNLIPIFPLDGGRIIKELLLFKFSKLKTINISEKISYIFLILITLMSSVLILYYKNIAILVGIIFVWSIAIIEFKKNKYRKIAYRVIDVTS